MIMMVAGVVICQVCILVDVKLVLGKWKMSTISINLVFSPSLVVCILDNEYDGGGPGDLPGS